MVSDGTASVSFAQRLFLKPWSQANVKCGLGSLRWGDVKCPGCAMAKFSCLGVNDRLKFSISGKYPPPPNYQP